MKPGVDFACTGDLPQAAAVANVASATSGDVARPETISTSGSSGAGLKKCMPTNRPGCFIPAASSVIDSDEVFDAMMQSSATTFSRLAKSSRFAASVLDDRLDDERRRARVRERADGLHARERRLGCRARQLSFCGELRERLRHRLFRGVGRAEARVVQLHRMTGLRRDLRDAGAHRAGAEDGDGAPGSERGGHRGTRHRPVKRGGRFSMNAATPSR